MSLDLRPEPRPEPRPGHVLACAHHDAHRCRSCTWLGQPYGDQLATKQADTEAALAAWPDVAWEPPVASRPAGFRNRAKMVVAGTVDRPTLGILDPRDPARGVDLRDCGLHTPGIAAALPELARFVTDADLEPYDVAARRGELKHLLVTESPDGALMVRFVVRSTESEARVRKHLPALRERLPALAVVTLNVQPVHQAVLEGDREIAVTAERELTMRLPAVTLRLPPGAFFQTNTDVAATLYATARAWTDELEPAGVLDLYCGVGGFALHLAGPGRRVHGVERSPSAVTSARRSAEDAGLAVAFDAGDATAARTDPTADADLVVVNPPRRGLGPELTTALDASRAHHLLYSSCDVASLARDLAALPTWRPVRGRVLDMFPQTAHREVLLLLRRT